MSEFEEVLDFTNAENDDENQCVRLKSGISIPKQGESLMIEPVLEEENFERCENEQETYFSKNRNATERLLQNMQDDFDITEDWEVLKQKMTPLTPDNGVFKFCKFVGHKDSTEVGYKSSITCLYELMIEGQDEPFDSSFIRGIPERFKLDSNQILPGIEILIKTMNIGETAIGILDSMYAFGELGVPPRIPPDCEIMVTVKLLKVTVQGEGEKLLGLPATVRLEKPLTEIVEAARTENQSGNQQFKSKEWKHAIQHYDFAIKVLQDRSEKEQGQEMCKDLLIKLHLNKAMCYINLDIGRKAVQECKKALGLERNNVKAHYRLGKAYALLKDYDKAKEEFLAAAALKPNDKEIEREMINLDDVIRRQNKQEFNYCQNMFKDYSKTARISESELLNSPYYPILKEFRESDREVLVMPGTVFGKEKGMMKEVANYLNLVLEQRNILGVNSAQQIRIRRKNN